ncbi:hypothetical protein Zmor_013087 [Zophobas morio]|uniref:Integrin beta subunit tail domain-containing protein n=1 Tax=Zophobas morio TaxID=2755281 RepID=A0AA38MEB1_9CUCU|nr:hypothetical protein Zmor_013087 [Zophobas morio]
MCVAMLCLFAKADPLVQTQKEVDLIDIDVTPSGLNKHEEVIQEMESEELILAEMEDSPRSDFLESSGDSEGSGLTIITTKDEDNVKNCIEEGYTSVCSNKGRCIDNKCTCHSFETEVDNQTIFYRHTGRYCEECPYCRAQRCHQYLPCIECNLFQKGANCNPYCQFQYEIVKKVTRNVDSDEKFCDIENTDGCFFRFKYHYNSQHSVVVQYEEDIFCFDGYKFLVLTFGAVVVYLFALTGLVPRICGLSRHTKICKSRTSLPLGHDVLRCRFFR